MEFKIWLVLLSVIFQKIKIKKQLNLTFKIEQQVYYEKKWNGIDQRDSS